MYASSCLHNLAIVPSSGVEAPFGSFSTSLSFRTRNRVAGRSLRTYLSHPLNFFHPLHHTWTRSRREGFYLAWTRSMARRSLTRLNSLDGEKVFNSCLYIAQGLHLLSLGGTEDFLLVPLHCPGLHLLSPGGTEDFLLFLACTRSTARRSLSLSRLRTREGVEVL